MVINLQNLPASPNRAPPFLEKLLSHELYGWYGYHHPCPGRVYDRKDRANQGHGKMGDYSGGFGRNLPGYGPHPEAFPQCGIYAQVPQAPDPFAWLFVKISKVRRFWTFFLIWVAELLAHTFLDLITSYGTMILSPFSNYRFALDWVFIIDLFLVSTFLFLLIALHLWKRKGQTLARVSVVLAAVYIALCAYNHSWALSLAKSYARQEGLVAETVASVPQPLSPFRWGNYILTEKKIYQGFVNLIGKEDKSTGEGNFLSRFLPRYPPISRIRYREWEKFDNSPWVEKSLKLEGVKTFYWFARFPVARDKGIVNGNHRVEFFDLRFGSIGGRRPFLYVVDFDGEGNVVYQGFL